MHEVKTESEVAQLCPTLRDPMDCSLPGSSAHGIFQARVLESVVNAFSEAIGLQRVAHDRVNEHARCSLNGSYLLCFFISL